VNKQEFVVWLAGQDQKDKMLGLVNQYGADKVLIAIDTLGNNDPSRIKQFILNQGCCAEA
jgi:hypothetical protein